MKIFLGIALLLAGCCSPVLGQTASRSQPYLQMQEALAGHDIDGFLKRASAEGWNPPNIYSRWHIGNRVTNPDRPALEAGREFGREMAREIADAAKRRPFPQSTAEARRFGESYLDLADWLNRSKGYGNIILGARCLDIAAVGVGYCVMDPTFPAKDLSPLVSRLRPRWLNAQAREEILNTESGTSLFTSNDNDGESNRVARLTRLWQTGHAQVLEQRDPSFKAMRIKHQEERRSNSKPQKAHLATEESYFDRPEITANLAFFADDALSGTATTVEMWDKKQHGRLVASLESANVVKVEALATFRQEVGSFPTNFAVEHPFYSGGKAAFDLAWRPHATKETRLLFVTAWHAYDELNSGKFLDQETRLDRCRHPAVVAP